MKYLEVIVKGFLLQRKVSDEAFRTTSQDRLIGLE
jgi:hypothetical protein